MRESEVEARCRVCCCMRVHSSSRKEDVGTRLCGVTGSYQVSLQGIHAGTLDKINTPGDRHGNDNAGARTADPSASRCNALRTTRQIVAPGGRHGNDAAAMEMTPPDDETP